MKCDIIEVLRIFFLGFYQLKFTFWVIYQCTETANIFLTHRSAIYFLNLTLDIARCILENMAKSLMLAVDIRDEVLGPLRQTEYSLKIDYLGTCGPDGIECT